MKKSIAWALLSALTLPAFANDHEHQHEHPAKSSATAAEEDFVNAEVKKIDPEHGKLTLKHEAIPKFQMGGMTMVFRMADPAGLNGLAVGDKVRFIPDKQNGQLMVKKIEKLKP